MFSLFLRLSRLGDITTIFGRGVRHEELRLNLRQILADIWDLKRDLERFNVFQIF